jgi:hypothetical protein
VDLIPRFFDSPVEQSTVSDASGICHGQEIEVRLPLCGENLGQALPHDLAH